MGYQTRDTEKIAGVKCGKRHKLDQPLFFARTLGHHHYDPEGDKIEYDADEIAYNEYLGKTIGMLHNQHYDVEEPDIVEYEVIKYGLKVGEEIGERKVTLRTEYVSMLPETETHKRFAPALTLTE